MVSVQKSSTNTTRPTHTPEAQCARSLFSRRIARRDHSGKSPKASVQAFARRATVAGTRQRCGSPARPKAKKSLGISAVIGAPPQRPTPRVRRRFCERSFFARLGVLPVRSHPARTAATPCACLKSGRGRGVPCNAARSCLLPWSTFFVRLSSEGIKESSLPPRIQAQLLLAKSRIDSSSEVSDGPCTAF